MIKRKNKKGDKSYNERVSELAYTTIREALQSVLTTEVKKTGQDGKEVTDCGLTISKMKMTARMALDFVDNLTKENKT
ncbi:MAG: hypothetical protein LUI60_02105 [Clostridia bacterium]|nr:hypothetical protein [Clostridia bacterium]